MVDMWGRKLQKPQKIVNTPRSGGVQQGKKQGETQGKGAYTILREALTAKK